MPVRESEEMHKVHALVAAGIGLLILSTIVVGWGAYLKAQEAAL